MATLSGVSETGALLGFAMVHRAQQWLEQLAVDPSQSGLGVGAVLLNAAKQMCGGRLGLRVNQDNPRAISFYRREGFRIVAAGVNPGGRRKTWDMLWTETSS